MFCESKISNRYLFQNPLESNEENFIQGEFCLVKGKTFETRGKNSNLRNASCNLIYL
jgi:hypothetical protein